MTPAKPALDASMPSAPSPSRPPGGAGRAGVYVHFPYCLAKCPYCDFYSVAADRSALPHAAYADAVIAELGRRAAECGPREVRSVFFGGGTPSLWEATELGRVLGALRAAFRVTSELEITVECNPTSFDAERARALIDAGVNRVSIGVQSLDAERLRFLGRLHDAPGALRAVETATRFDALRVSADLIFGVAGETPEEGAREAATLAELGVTHLSAYALTIEPGTRFGVLARAGKLPLCPEDAVADGYQAIADVLRARGFHHYEISNYARDGEVAAHNVGYWRGEDYVGLGAGAVGTVLLAERAPARASRGPAPGARRVRYRNAPSVERYLASPGAPAGELELIDGETALRERLMLGLRMSEGVDVAEAARATGGEAWPEARARAAARLVARGRLAQDGDHLAIPEAAWLLADGTIAELI